MNENRHIPILVDGSSRSMSFSQHR